MRIGIDLGGSKIAGIALADDGRALTADRTATPHDSYEKLIGTIASMVRGLEAAAGARGPVGVGIPGSVSRQTGVVTLASIATIVGKPFDRDLSRALGRPVRIDNDANCFALSEATDGAGAGYETVFGVIIGTGCGGGIVTRKRVIVGRNAIAGEWGHNPLPWPTDDERPGPPCFCGKHGCIQQFVSGPALAYDYRVATGEAVSAAEVEARAEAGERAALAALDRLEHRFARALATIINVLDPDAIVLGGGLSKIARLYRNVPPLLPDWVFGRRADTPILPPEHGDASGVRGAAWLWQPEEAKQLYPV